MRDPQARATRLLEQFTRRMLSDDPRSGLAAGQWAILRYLGKHPNELRSINQVTKHLGELALPVHRAIAALSRKRLIALEDDGTGTGHLISLTTEGRAKLREDPIWRIETALMRLSPEDQRELCRMLTILTDAQTRDLLRK